MVVSVKGKGIEAKSIDDILVVMIPTPQMKVFVDTPDFFTDVAALMGKQKVSVTINRQLGYSDARNHQLAELKSVLDDNHIEYDPKAVRMLWFDSDEVITSSAQEVAEWLAEADKRNINLVGNYHMLLDPYRLSISNTLFKITENPQDLSKPLIGKSYTDEELGQFKAYDPMPETVGGFGFLYLKMPIDYRFKSIVNSEDFMCMRELDLKVNYCPVRILHEKTVYI